MVSHTIYDIVLKGLFIFAAFAFIALIFLNAPYGRHLRKGWGPVLPAKFSWIIMELPAVVVILYFFITGSTPKNVVLILFFLIWQFHYIQRTFIYPFLVKSSKSFPVLIILFGMSFNTMNGYVNGHYLFSMTNDYTLTLLYDPRFIFWVILFFIGFSINVYSDYILRNLRKTRQSEYQIPDKGLFQYVANPNYLGEIIEWTGWAILTWSLPGLAFMVFTVANLVPRAYSNHKWYRENFLNYPQKRKAIIPFIL